ncbi:MAG: hypothetical protein QF489_09755 [Planctomycetota bacterium]|jgi:hypothetical protein|nr:hypothetical protein [Planctomycetota bacterium]
MNTTNHTSDRSSTESLPVHKKAPVYVCAAGQPVASVAEWVMASWWQGYREGPVAMVLVGQSEMSAFVTALRARFLNLEAEASDSKVNQALPAAVQAATDRGACLIAGGQNGLPSLVTNTLLSGSLLDALQAPAPLLLVCCQEENQSAVEDLAERLRLLPFPPQT